MTNCFKFLLWLSHNDRLATSHCQPSQPFLPGSCFCRGVSPEATGNRHGPVCVVVSGHARRSQKTALGYWFFPSVVGCKNQTQGIRLAQQVFLLAGLVILNLVTQFFSKSFVDGKIVYQKADLPTPPPNTQPLSVVILFFSVNQGASNSALPASASQGLRLKACTATAPNSSSLRPTLRAIADTYV